MKKNTVIAINQKQEEIIIKISEQAEQDEILDELKKKMKDLR